MTVEHIVFPDDVSAATACGEEMLRLIEAARNTAGRAAAGFDWTGVHVFFVDERCVPPTDSASNYKNGERILPARDGSADRR